MVVALSEWFLGSVALLGSCGSVVVLHGSVALRVVGVDRRGRRHGVFKPLPPDDVPRCGHQYGPPQGMVGW